MLSQRCCGLLTLPAAAPLFGAKKSRRPSSPSLCLSEKAVMCWYGEETCSPFDLSRKRSYGASENTSAWLKKELPHLLSMRGRFPVVKQKCSTSQTFGDSEGIEHLKKVESPADSATRNSDVSFHFMENALHKFLQPLKGLQLVKETISSKLFIFLVGVLIYMDFKSTSLFSKQFHNIVAKSYTVSFFVSAFITTILGFFSIPFLRRLKAYQVIRIEGPSTHSSKVNTPTMGGLYFIPVGVFVAAMFTHASSAQVKPLLAATFAFGAIGLLDDVLSLVRKHNYGLPGWYKLCFEAIAGILFYYWHRSANFPSPIRVETLVLFPRPLPHIDFGSWYVPFTSLCFASMSNGVNLTDGLDGLGAGTAAPAFLGMSLALSHIYPAVALFGVSMAGACVGFLVHNHHKAAVFMGDTGSLALGGALAAMAASSGMFFPLFICSGVFFVEILSVVIQMSYKKWTEKRTGIRRGLFRMAPLHHHFELGGVPESRIVGFAQTVSCVLAVLGGYVGILCLK